MSAPILHARSLLKLAAMLVALPGLAAACSASPEGAAVDAPLAAAPAASTSALSEAPTRAQSPGSGRALPPGDGALARLAPSLAVPAPDGLTVPNMTVEGSSFRYQPHLTKGSGPVIANAKIVGLYWPGVDQDGASAVSTLYAQVPQSAYFDMLAEYGVGRGALDSQAFVNPTTSATLTEDVIASEIYNMIMSGHVSPPDANTVYMVHLSASVRSTYRGGEANWGGYHWQKTIGGYTITFGVLPAYSPGGKANGTGADANWINNLTAAASHELVEILTDPGAGGWRDDDSSSDINGNEIGDLCNANQETIVVRGHAIVVQRMWSNAANACVTSNPTGYVHIPQACASAIGSGGPSLWILGCSPVGSDYQPYQWNGIQFVKTSGAAKVIAVSSDGNAWVANAAGAIFKWNATKSAFQPIAAASPCRDVNAIGVGANDDAWITGCAGAGGRQIWHLVNGTSGTWQRVQGSADKIAVMSKDGPWVLNASGQLFAWDKDNKKFIPPGSNVSPTYLPDGVQGTAQSVAVTEKGAYIIGTDGAVYSYRNAFPGWDQIAGYGAQIAATTDGTPWVVDTDGQIYRFDQSR